MNQLVWVSVAYLIFSTVDYTQTVIHVKPDLSDEGNPFLKYILKRPRHIQVVAKVAFALIVLEVAWHIQAFYGLWLLLGLTAAHFIGATSWTQAYRKQLKKVRINYNAIRFAVIAISIIIGYVLSILFTRAT